MELVERKSKPLVCSTNQHSSAHSSAPLRIPGESEKSYWVLSFRKVFPQLILVKKGFGNPS